MGGGLVFAPAGEKGVFALRAEDGGVAWHFTGGSCHATPTYDAAAGEVWRLDAKTGKELGRAALKGTLNKALLLAEGKVYALSFEGALQQLDAATLKPGWTYDAGAAASTLPAYSASKRMVIFCSDDLQVHVVNAATSDAVWKRHPSGKDVKHRAEFTAGWPVVLKHSGK